jgi:dihydroorotase
MDLTVEGKIFHKGMFENACIGIKDGKIVDIKKILKAGDHLDFGNKLILPAGVDNHVHFREPGMIHKEDWSTGSLAAAFGGISCVFDMPNTVPQTTSVQTIEDKIINACRKSYVDFGVYAGVTKENLENIEKLSKKCNGFKIFLGSSTLSMLFDKNKLREAFDLIGISKKPVIVHCEDEECLIKHRKVEKNLTDHMRFRPGVCEEIAIGNVLKAANGLNTKVHICHLSSCEGLELLKNKPANVSFGITPHHSLLNIKNNMGSPSLFKVNPPIRSSFDRESLFNSIKNGSVSTLESDHAPHTRDEKDKDFDEAPSGVPGVETMYPLFLYMAKKEILTFQRLVYLLCSNPADLLGICKGRIEPGYDADFIVVDLKKEEKIRSETLHSKAGWSPFEDWPAVFPESVFISGEKVIDEKEIQVKQGFGRFVGE